MICQLIVLPAAAQGNLPQLGDGNEMGVAAERKLGQRIAREIYRDPDYIDDPLLVEYIQGIWQPLLRAARARGDISPELDERFAWEVMLARDRSVNAFALPGGYLGLHLGLVAIVTNRDELASVLAHELSHVTQRHIARITSKQNQQAPWILGAMILGALAARKNAEAANAAIVGSQAVAAQGQLNFSRDMEREADRIGFGVVTDAGFSANGFGSMFEKLQLANRINDNGSFPYLRSHPLTSERIGDMQARLQLQSPSSPGTGSLPAVTAEHAIMAARARILADPSVDALRAAVEQGRLSARAVGAGAGALTAASAGSSTTSSAGSAPGAASAASGAAPSTALVNTWAGLYAGALAAMKLRDLAQASQWTSLLRKAVIEADKTRFAGVSSALRAINLLATEIQIAQGQFASVLTSLAAGGAAPGPAALSEGAGQAAPAVGAASGAGSTSIPATTRLNTLPRAELLLWTQAAVAERSATPSSLAPLAQALQARVSQTPQDAPLWSALAATYSAQGFGLRAIRAQAEGRVALLDYSAALDRLKAGQALARAAGNGSNSGNIDYIESSIIDSRARAVELLLKESLQDKPQ